MWKKREAVIFVTLKLISESSSVSNYLSGSSLGVPFSMEI